MSASKPPRSSRHRHRRQHSIPPDPIDVLDATGPGGFYHHPGPYDATLLSRNLNPKYSPVAAVRDSNMKALRATPRDFITDSLTKHVPLQGTASIPPGGRDLHGDVMDYEDGADLMREEGAPGGAYKRWAGVSYHPNDLKGKGEPSYTIEEAQKSRRLHKLATSSSGTAASDSSYDLPPYRDHAGRSNPKSGDGPKGRQRSASEATPQYSHSSGLQPESGIKGLRKRLGSLRGRGRSGS
ncbi:uncharacterized protein DNG_04932 [Cephalotrichum gorgonifer]|uniref:Uncharacterized protein n=1 Tax=Cephalotrichum gorgonifer TaxID=2041049 RepID=A0AAE8MZ16_9PEZI|nr:uncharacterized protein DNG_04932 [Cephalotrichum gorgonifer]